MSSQARSRSFPQPPVEANPRCGFDGPPPAEEDVHREHRAALEATLFGRSCGAADELVFEIERGLLLLRDAG